MKSLNQFIIEKFKFGKNKISPHNYYPKNLDELIQIINEKCQTNNSDTLDLQDIEVSNIESFYKLFRRVYVGKYKIINISGWNISNAISLSEMFQNCSNLEQIIGIEDLDVSNIAVMNNMFSGCEAFDADLSKWNVSKLESAQEMFFECMSFKGIGLDKWETKKLSNVNGMFYECEEFDADLGNWNISEIRRLNDMFCGCYKFKGKGLEKWDVSKIDSMNHTFASCFELCCDLSKWDVSSVGSHINTFYDCSKMPTKYKPKF